MRSIEADMSMDAPAARPVSRDETGRGDVGLYHGTTSTLQYDDGSIGPMYGYRPGDPIFIYDGTASSVINNRSQLLETGRTFGNGALIYDLSFHSSLSYTTTETQFSPWEGSAEEDVTGPFVEARRQVADLGSVKVDVLAGLALFNADFGSGQQTLANQTVRRVTERYTYTYDHAGLVSGAAQPGAVFPFTDRTAFTAVDTEFVNSPAGWAKGGALDPRRKTTTTSEVTSRWTALGDMDVEFDLQEIILAPEFSIRLCSYADIRLAVGPTINVIETDLSAWRSWQRNGATVSTERIDENDSTVEIGWAVQASLLINLTPRLFIEGSFSYRDVPSVGVESGFASTEVDASSTQGAIGLGVTL